MSTSARRFLTLNGARYVGAASTAAPAPAASAPPTPAAAPVLAPKVQQAENGPPSALWKARYRWFVLGTAFIHGLTMILILVLGLSKDWPVRLCASYSSWQPANPALPCMAAGTNGTAANICTVVTRYKRVGNLSPIGLLAAFCGLSAAFQGVPALFNRTWAMYLTYLEQCQQPLRWAEYSLSSSLMVAIIMVLNGNTDFWIYLGAVGLNWATMLFGLMHEKLLFTQSELERQNAGYKFALVEKTLAHWVGWVAFSLVWLLLVAQFTWSIEDAANTSAAAGHSFPKWVTAIIWTQFLLFLTFGLNQLAATRAQLGGLKWVKWSYRKSEVTYTVLSLAAKQLLVWLLYFGTTMRNPKTLLVNSPC